MMHYPGEYYIGYGIGNTLPHTNKANGEAVDWRMKGWVLLGLLSVSNKYSM